jgi:hypothetical protein
VAFASANAPTRTMDRHGAYGTRHSAVSPVANDLRAIAPAAVSFEQLPLIFNVSHFDLIHLFTIHFVDKIPAFPPHFLNLV